MVAIAKEVAGQEGLVPYVDAVNDKQCELTYQEFLEMLARCAVKWTGRRGGMGFEAADIVFRFLKHEFFPELRKKWPGRF